MMKSTFKLFMILVTMIVAIFGWITGQYRDRDYLILILALVSATMLSFLLLNISERRIQERRRKERESRTQLSSGPEAGKIKRSDASFSLKEKKSGLSWGGGNIKASEATRGTKRKFLGR